MMLPFALTSLELGMTQVAECCTARWRMRTPLKLGMMMPGVLTPLELGMTQMAE